MKLFILTLSILFTIFSSDAYALRCAPFNAKKLMNDANVEIIIGSPTHSWRVDPVTGEILKKGESPKKHPNKLLSSTSSANMLYNIDVIKSFKKSLKKHQVITVEGRNIGSWKARRLIVSRTPTNYFIVLNKKKDSNQYSFGPCSPLTTYVPEYAWLIKIAEEKGYRKGLENKKKVE